jgi:predicted dehydrogenase
MTTRVVVVGAGKMGAHHARVFSHVDGARVTGVLDVRRDAAARVAELARAAMMRSEDEAIECADLVVIATPTEHHFAYAERALAAGRHVLVEKPIAATSREARVLCDLARARGVVLMAGHSERFNPVVRALALACAEDSPTRIETHRAAAAAEGELCINLAVHDIDIVAHLTRARVELASTSGDADRADIGLRAAAATARVRVERSSARVRTIHMYSARFSYDGDLVAGHLERDGVALLRAGDSSAEPLALQARAALAAIVHAPSDIASGEDGLEAVAIAEDAARRLARHVPSKPTPKPAA